MPAKEATLTIIMGCKNGSLRRVTFPANWKITFGSVNPGGKVYDPANHGLCLRLYENKDKQRAVFTDVMWFRDEALPVTERVTRKRTKRIGKHGTKNDNVVVAEMREHKWVDPLADEEDESAEDGNFAKLTAGDLEFD